MLRQAHSMHALHVSGMRAVLAGSTLLCFEKEGAWGFAVSSTLRAAQQR